MLFCAIHVCAILVSRLPTDSIDRARCDGVIDIMSIIAFEILHTGKSLFIQLKNVARYSSTGTTSYTCAIYMGLAHESFEIFEGRLVVCHELM
jgi:hypothetical protein